MSIHEVYLDFAEVIEITDDRPVFIHLEGRQAWV
jgi:hypothetical protein